MFRRRPKAPQGAGSPSAVSGPHTAPGSADVEVTGVAATTPAPRPAVHHTSLARCAAGTLLRTDFGREIWVGEHVGVLVALQQWHTAHRSVITVVNDEGVDTFEVSAFDTVIYETQGATK